VGGVLHAYKRREKHANLCLANFQRRPRRMTILLKWVLKEYVERVWTGLTWLRLGTIGGPGKHSKTVVVS
jgi:hypothetical protein